LVREATLRTKDQLKLLYIPSLECADKELDTASMISRGEPTTFYGDMKKLGEGASGQVYLATDRRTHEKVAIKIAPSSDLTNLKQEIALQKLSSHPCIVSYKETYLHKDQLWVWKRASSC
jgi:serine/threonine protein kinase